MRYGVVVYQPVFNRINFSIYNQQFDNVINIKNLILVLTFSTVGYYFMNLFCIICVLHILGLSGLEIISNLPSISFYTAKQILYDLRRLPFVFNVNLHLQPMGAGDSVGQPYSGLHDTKKGLINYMERDPEQGGSPRSTSTKGSANKGLVPYNKSGNIVQPGSGSGNRGLAPSNSGPSNRIAPLPTEPKKPLDLKQSIIERQALASVTNTSPSTSSGTAASALAPTPAPAPAPATNPGPSTSSGATAPATTGMEGSGRNSAVMIPSPSGQLLPGRYTETPDG